MSVYLLCLNNLFVICFAPMDSLPLFFPVFNYDSFQLQLFINRHKITHNKDFISMVFLYLKSRYVQNAMNKPFNPRLLYKKAFHWQLRMLECTLYFFSVIVLLTPSRHLFTSMLR